MRLQAHFEKSAYLPGQNFKVLVELDNTQSKLDISQIVVKFIRVLELRNSKYKDATYFRDTLC